MLTPRSSTGPNCGATSSRNDPVACKTKSGRVVSTTAAMSVATSIPEASCPSSAPRSWPASRGSGSTAPTSSISCSWRARAATASPIGPRPICTTRTMVTSFPAHCSPWENRGADDGRASPPPLSAPGSCRIPGQAIAEGSGRWNSCSSVPAMPFQSPGSWPGAG